MMERVKLAVAGFFIGGFLGWFMGVAWYEAASMDAVMAPSYLSATDGALALLALPGAILGAIVGALRKPTGKSKKSRNQTIWFII
jgi:hypothetical protein